MKRSCYLFAIHFLFIGYIYAQAPKPDPVQKSIDSLVLPHFQPNEPGVSILIARQGKIIYEKSFGSANIELNVPLQPGMVFKIGSVTKQFTAIGILQLVEQGKISLQDSIQKYINDFPSKGHTITIENLLTHTSGIKDYNDADTTHNPYIERQDFRPLQLIKSFNYWPLEFEPGTRYSYSNSGYVLLAYIIEKVSGESYHAYMEKNVLKAAGLTNTFYAGEKKIVPQRVNGYTKDNGYYENTEYQSISIAYGCGDLMSSVEDLYKWNIAILSHQLVKKETLDKAFTPFRLKNGSYTGYGYGWFIDSLPGTKCIHHEGQISGFIAVEKYFPAEDIYLAILTNLRSGEDKTNFSNERFRLFETISLIALGKEIIKEIAVNDAILDSYIGTYEATFTKNQTLIIYKREGKLYADLSNGTGRNMLLQAQSETKFFLPDIKHITTSLEFINENGHPVKLIVTQDKKYEWRKIK